MNDFRCGHPPMPLIYDTTPWQDGWGEPGTTTLVSGVYVMIMITIAQVHPTKLCISSPI